MRKEKVSFVLATVRAEMIKSFGEVAGKLTPMTLLDAAENMGYVTGRRGRDGGYFITDEGLTLIGEDVEAFKAAEAAADEAHAKSAKERQAAAAKDRKEKLAAGLNAALAIVQATTPAPTVEAPAEPMAEEVTEKPKKKNGGKKKKGENKQAA
jgi:hypothetical protein